MASYFTSPKLLGLKTSQLVSQVEKIKITVVESELESLLLEAFYIKKYKPKYNIRLTDSKTYPMIKITINHPNPAVVITRKIEEDSALYFGPYPSSAAVKLVLRTIRRIFPFHSSLNHPRRYCLYYHLGICPCLPMFPSPETRIEYKKNLRRVVRILEGESRKVLKELEKERDKLSKTEHYEKAILLQRQITALTFITNPFHVPFEYDLNPNLREDLRSEELENLRVILLNSGYQIIKPIIKIECYDISHLQGTFTTASMAVFVNGEKETSSYRKYKIRLEKTPDDFASMKEVLLRRFRHTEWQYPDLIIIDGGKGQVSASLEILNQLNINIPLIGLAKRDEIIVLPLLHPLLQQHKAKNIKIKNDDSFAEIILPKDTKALLLIRRIRDEAHRFAVSYHKKLRAKALVS